MIAVEIPEGLQIISAMQDGMGILSYLKCVRGRGCGCASRLLLLLRASAS